MFEVLKDAPFIGAAVRSISGNLRLFLEYVLIGAVIACTAAAIGLWYQTKRLEGDNRELAGRIAVVETVNSQQDLVIDELKALRQRDNEVFTGLLNSYTTLSKNDVRARKKLLELESKNASVREYLAGAIPPELACVLNYACQDDTSSGPSRATK